MRKILFIVFLALSSSLFTFCGAQTGTWSALTNLPPHSNYGVCLLMTDGTVICKNHTGGGYGRGWDRLTPDIHGSYMNGTWDTIAPMHLDRLFFSTQILPDGRVYAAGGEYGSGDTAGEVYDPATNSWTMCGPTPDVPNKWNIYDGNSEILYDGTVLEGPQIGADPSFDCLIYNPVTNLYTIAPTAFYNHDEAEWLKLPDSSVLFVGIATPYSNRYIPKYNKWVHDDTTPGMLYDQYGEEAGCALMLPNGKAVFFGATPYNCIYTPSGDTNPGTWVSADSFPKIQGGYVGQPDASGAMMVNGHILLAVSPIGVSSDSEFLAPAYFVEYNYNSNTFTQVKSVIPGQGGDSIHNIACYQTQMLDLPDGNVLVSISQTGGLTKQYYIYTPGSGPIPQGKPVINNIIPNGCFDYKITGKLFNGLSEGAAYGDDWQMSTNWPLVRLTDGSGNVYYAKTSNWNRVGAVRTDSLEDTAYFALPSMPGGTYSVQVVVNGFASSPATITTFGVAITAQTNIVCHGFSSGSATALASDGIAPYTYSWAPSGGTNATASNLSAGTYTVTAVSSGGGCAATAAVIITQPSALGVSITSAISCTGANNAYASANVTGGTSPYTYNWTGGGGTNSMASGLSVGTYSVTVQDACGSSASASVNILAYITLTVSIDSIHGIKCNGDSNATIYSSYSGGTPPYSFSWSNGGNHSSVANLHPGSYTVTVSDSCGSTVSAGATITQPAPLVVTLNILPTSSSSCTGIAWVTVSGGTTPYTYVWSNGNTTDSISHLCDDIFCCTVTDAHGCYHSPCATIPIATGINTISSNSGRITIYPNPNNGAFTLQVESEKLKGESGTIEIYNVLGEKVYFQLTTFNAPLSIDLRTSPNGIYLYRVINDDGSLAGEGKLIIEK